MELGVSEEGACLEGSILSTLEMLLGLADVFLNGGNQFLWGRESITESWKLGECIQQSHRFTKADTV
jgi:hypothetical protein